MAFIEVNYIYFTNAAAYVEQYVSRQKEKMGQATETVNSLRSSWSGEDSEAFVSKWNEIDDRSSTASQLEQSLEDYAEVLKYAADQYKEAQKKAIGLANRL